MQNQRQRPSLTINSKKAATVPAPPAMTPGGGRNPYQTPHASTSNFGLYQLGGSSYQTPTTTDSTVANTSNLTKTNAGNGTLAAFSNLQQNPLTPVTPFARNSSLGSTSSPSCFQLNPPNTPAAFQRSNSKVSVNSAVEYDDFDEADDSRNSNFEYSSDHTNSNNNNVSSVTTREALYGKIDSSSSTGNGDDINSEHNLSLYSQSSLAEIDTLNGDNNKQAEKVKFSRSFDILLYNNYQTYISNPQITPFSGRYPPSGVVSVVAKESLRIALEGNILIELNSVNNSRFTSMNISSYDYSALMGQVRHRLIELCSNGIDPSSGYINHNGSSVNLRNSSVASLNSLHNGSIIANNNNNVEESLSKLTLNKNLVISTSSNNQSTQFRSPIFSPISQTFSPITTVFNNNANNRVPTTQDDNNNILPTLFTNDESFFASNVINNNAKNFNNVLLSSMGGAQQNITTSNRTHADFAADPLTPITPVGIYPPYLSNKFIGNRSPEVHNSNNNNQNSSSVTNSPSNVKSSPQANPISCNVIQVNDGNESSNNSDRSIMTDTISNPSTTGTSELSLSSPFRESFELQGLGNNNIGKSKQNSTSSYNGNNINFIKNSTTPGKSSKLKLSTTFNDTLPATNESAMLGKPPTLIIRTEHKEDFTNNSGNLDGLLSPAGINLRNASNDNRLDECLKKTTLVLSLRKTTSNQFYN